MSAARSESNRNLDLRFNAIQRIARQQARDTFFGWGFYVTAALAVLGGAFLIYNSVRFVSDSGLNILSRPFFLPFQVVVTLAMLFVTIEATLAIARPREQGTLQVLFFAPINESVVILGHFLAGLVVFIVFILLLTIPLFLVTWLTNFVWPVALLWTLLPTLLVAGVSLAFGLFLSAAAPSARSAILLLVAAFLGLLVIQGAYAALLSIPPTGRFYDAFLFVRLVLRDLQQLLVWISPFSMLESIFEAALRGEMGRLAVRSIAALALIVTWLAAALWALRRRGVLPS